MRATTQPRGDRADNAPDLAAGTSTPPLAGAAGATSAPRAVTGAAAPPTAGVACIASPPTSQWRTVLLRQTPLHPPWLATDASSPPPTARPNAPTPPGGSARSARLRGRCHACAVRGQRRGLRRQARQPGGPLRGAATSQRLAPAGCGPRRSRQLAPSASLAPPDARRHRARGLGRARARPAPPTPAGRRGAPWRYGSHARRATPPLDANAVFRLGAHVPSDAPRQGPTRADATARVSWGGGSQLRASRRRAQRHPRPLATSGALSPPPAHARRHRARGSARARAPAAPPISAPR